MSRPTHGLPKTTPWLFRGFRKYCVRYARKHFHGVRISKASAPLPLDGAPILIAMNHPGWWDPILCVLLSREFADTTHYGAIDAEALKQYAFMRRIGLFPVERENIRSAAAFLKTGQLILNTPKSALWITAQGRFADVRTRPLALQSGVGHLAARMTTGWVLPIAVEYAFWNESKPEALVRIGEAFPISNRSAMDGKAWTARIEERLTATLDALNAEAMSRDAAKFTSLIAGKTGVGGAYDLWRRTKAFATGKTFDSAHESPP